MLKRCYIFSSLLFQWWLLTANFIATVFIEKGKLLSGQASCILLVHALAVTRRFLMYWTPVHREVYNIHLCFGIVVKFTLRIPFLRAFETEMSGPFIAFCHAFRGASVTKPWGFLVLNNQVGMTFNLKSTTKESFSVSIFSFVTWWLSNMIQNVIINKKLQRFPRWCLFALPRTD